jgi:hypothetical protein
MDPPIPTERIVLRPAVKGTKCLDVHRHYQAIPGNSSKLRCSLCYTSWQIKTTDQLLASGQLLTAAGVLAHPPATVTTLAKAATASLRMHLIRDHGAVESTSERPPKTQKLAETWERAPHMASYREKASALALCFNPMLTFSQLDCPWFKQAFGHPCSKADAPKALFGIRNELVDKIKVSPFGIWHLALPFNRNPSKALMWLLH